MFPLPLLSVIRHLWTLLRFTSHHRLFCFSIVSWLQVRFSSTLMFFFRGQTVGGGQPQVHLKGHCGMCSDFALPVQIWSASSGEWEINPWPMCGVHDLACTVDLLPLASGTSLWADTPTPLYPRRFWNTLTVVGLCHYGHRRLKSLDHGSLCRSFTFQCAYSGSALTEVSGFLRTRKAPHCAVRRMGSRTVVSCGIYNVPCT